MPASSLGKIQHFVVLMLENRSFDHLLGSLQSVDPRVAGKPAAAAAWSKSARSQFNTASGVRAPAKRYTMSFDPGHEFDDIQIQLYGLYSGATRGATRGTDRLPNRPVTPAPMSGFVSSAQAAAPTLEEADRVMEYYRPAQIPVLATLAREFAICNFWHASLPGPTWPNRFFVHAATSGGLTASPSETQILGGYSFQNQTIFERLGVERWRVYHDGLPQCAGIDSLRREYVDPLTKNFRHMSEFASDVKAGDLPAYTFIEPAYDTGHDCINGNSMHPLNDIREGEKLIKLVYDTLRNSALWPETMLVVTCDEHGGFYDHVPPPAAVAPGDEARYATPGVDFGFDLLGVRVPAVIVTAYTQRGTVIGTTPDDPSTRFDHTSILATLEARFGLAPLTERDRTANTLVAAINQNAPRLSDEEAPSTLPTTADYGFFTRFMRLFESPPVAPSFAAPLTSNQHAFLALAMACDIEGSTDPTFAETVHLRRRTIYTVAEAAAYISEVEKRIRERRRRPAA
jgi:phospholipase C